MKKGDKVYFGPYGDFCVSNIYTIKDMQYSEVFGTEYTLVGEDGHEFTAYTDEVRLV